MNKDIVKKDRVKKEMDKNKMKRRLLALFILFILTFIFLAGRVVSINVKEKQQFQTSVLSQHMKKQTSSSIIPAQRGSIVDRNGTVFAESIKVYNVFYDPGVLNQFDQVVIDYTNELVSTLIEDVTVEGLNNLLKEKPNSNYEVLAKGLSYERARIIEEALAQKKPVENEKEIILAKGVHLEGYYVRIYPYNTMASDVIGFYSGKTGGTYGVEEYYEEALKGVSGRLFGSLDNGNIVNQEEVQPQNGNDLMLTLDFTIQKYVEESIVQYYEEHDAKSVNVIVMNPKNGEILAMASAPAFNLNEPFNLEGIIDATELSGMSNEEKYIERFELWKNFNVSATYEPGSTYKPITLAAALEEGKISLDHTFECEGGKQVANYYIKCWKDGGHGVQTTVEALANSCNVAFMEMGEALGVDFYYDYQHMYGFGAKTNIDMLGEEKGLLYTYDQYGSTELATGSFGQGFNITPIQLITAFSSIVNGGYLYEPTIMKKITDDKGRIVLEKEPRQIRQVVSKETALEVTRALETTVTGGTGSAAKIEGYHIGGKTGTAEKGNRQEDKYVISFIGFAPVEDPQLVTLVVIDEPVTDYVVSGWAVQVFNNIMQKILPYKAIFPDTELSHSDPQTQPISTLEETPVEIPVN